MSTALNAKRPSLSPTQIALFVMIACLAITVEVLILRGYFETSRTSEFFETASAFTTDLANIQREALLLQIETNNVLTGQATGFERVDLRRALLTNQLRVQRAQAIATNNVRVIDALGDINITLAKYDALLARLRQTPDSEWDMAVPDIHEALVRLERQIKVLYDQEEIAFFEATSLALRTQRTSEIISLSGAGLVLFLGVVLAFSLRRSVRALWAEMEVRIRAEEENKQLAESLELRVVERTTELTAALEQLERVSRHKSEFLANMSHELRTPLNAIIGYSEMLEEQAEDEDQHGFIPDLQRVRSAGKHLLDLVSEVLDFSRIEAGKIELYLETFSIAKVVEEVADIIHPLAERNGNTLEVHLHGNVGSMRADITKVKQTLFNLLSNACKFTENGSISLTVKRKSNASQDWIAFTVSDTGIGISPEQMTRLFQPFSQADESTTRRYGGTGLGLALSRSFCQIMGGDVSAESEPGMGSTFTVTLPATVVEPPVELKPVMERRDAPDQGNGAAQHAGLPQQTLHPAQANA